MRCKVCFKKRRVLEFCDKHYRRWIKSHDLQLVQDDEYWKKRSGFMSKAGRKKLGEFRKTQVGKYKHTDKIKKHLRKMKLGIKNPLWKGDKVGYTPLHIWVRRNKPKPNKCEICKEDKKLEVSNKNGKYSRNLNDWQWICKRCHHYFDIEHHKRNDKGMWIGKQQ